MVNFLTREEGKSMRGIHWILVPFRDFSGLHFPLEVCQKESEGAEIQGFAAIPKKCAPPSTGLNYVEQPQTSSVVKDEPWNDEP
jgi:hypothetical protein